MIIVGDAAHATALLGARASMAIEDAVVLARCLRDLPDTGQAFAAYERLRRARVERIVAQGEDEQQQGRRSRRPGTARPDDAPDPQACCRGESLAWMHDYHIEWDAKVA